MDFRRLEPERRPHKEAQGSSWRTQPVSEKLHLAAQIRPAVHPEREEGKAARQKRSGPNERASMLVPWLPPRQLRGHDGGRSRGHWGRSALSSQSQRKLWADAIAVFPCLAFMLAWTFAPGLSGLEPRLKQRKRSLGATLVFASATWCGFAIRCASTTWFGWFRAPLKPYLATAAF